MSQITRYHHGGILVPVALLKGIDSVFSVSAGGAEDFGLYPCEALDLERLVTVPALWKRTTDVTTSAEALSDARNVLDGWTLSSECHTETEANCIDRPTDDGPCAWCQSLLLRDWCDAVLDRAGFKPPPYSDPTPDDFDPEAEYDHLMRPTTEGPTL